MLARRQNEELDPVKALEQRNKAAIYHTVGKICEEINEEIDTPISKEVMACLSEAVLKKSEILGRDLESFARHRSGVSARVSTTIRSEDVLLAARNCGCGQAKELLKGMLPQNED
eukprot:Nk52_evm5s235 gene=Nk52_evmTU5s235